MKKASIQYFHKKNIPTRVCSQCGAEVPLEYVCLLPETEKYYHDFFKHLIDNSYPAPKNIGQIRNDICLCPSCKGKMEQEEFEKQQEIQ